MSEAATPALVAVQRLACAGPRGDLPFSLADYPAAEGAAPALALLLAHGAGGNRESAFMLEAVREFTAGGVRVLLFNFPYAEAGRKPPDRAPVLLAAYRAALAGARRLLSDSYPLVLGGKSMGARYAAQTAATDPTLTPGSQASVVGTLYLGYPLHPPGKPERLRTEGLTEVAVPQLFVQGERDPFGTPDELAQLVEGLPRARLHTVPHGDHSLGRPKRDGVALTETLAGVLATLRAVLGDGAAR